MKQQLQAFIAEIIKNKHSPITWITFIAFSLAPLFGGLFMMLMKGDGYEGLSGAFKTKAVLMSFEANWNSYLVLLSQAVGVGGVLIFGFVASWLFGREYADNTAKDLLSLPISRVKILNAKFIYYVIWCFALVIWNLLLGLLLGFLLQLPGWDVDIFLSNMRVYFITTILIMLLNTPIAFFAIYGKGYLVPLGIVAILLVLAQIIGAMGIGNYFPWAVPGIYSGSGGAGLKDQLNILSYIILIVTSVAGYVSTILWWKYADQTI
ncbi:MAG: bacitracin ABC transporter permease [Gammaproteobacteria bacterium SG8_11]|nr:MAG: bacitracin ABC transporter permease [Gammaproteobacteria bacterium SG8_11]